MGRVVVAGYRYTAASSNDFAVVRLGDDGVLDPSFDGDGKVATPIGSGMDVAYGVAIDSLGRIVVVGKSHDGSKDTFAVVRYDANGALDSTFDGDGIVTTAISSLGSEAYAVALDLADRIVVAGFARTYPGVGEFAVARYTTGGMLDSSFDGDGIAMTSGTLFEAFGVAIDGAGRIVVAGRSNLARFDSSGALDPTLDGDGVVSLPGMWATSVAIDGSGRIVVAGKSNSDFTVRRLRADGSLDPSFSGGAVTTPIGSALDDGRAVAIDSAGRILVGGYTVNAGNWDFAAVRYRPDGSLDPLFDGDGIVTTAIGAGTDVGLAAAVDGADRLVVAGYSIGSASAHAVVRYEGGPPNTPPVARLELLPERCVAAASLALDASTSFDPDAWDSIVRYEWDVDDDGDVDAASSVPITALSCGPLELGSHSIRLRVTDGLGATATTVGTMVRAACGDSILDSGETCDDGNTVDADCCSSACQIEAAGTVCRAALGDCDVAEVCDGASPACPATNALAPAGAPCASDGNVCTDDACDGAGACLHSSNAAPCDDGVFCNGSDGCTNGSCSAHAGNPCAAGAECADTCNEAAATCLRAAGTPCSDDGSLCSTDQCDGSGACVHVAGHAGTVCRPSAGDCDLAESCTGSSVWCPADQLAPSSIVCRPAIDACDLAESCDGLAADCPADSGVPDSDGDLVCDAEDRCTNPAGARDFLASPKPKLIVAKINTDTTVGNDKLAVQGEMLLPIGTPFTAINPQAHGARLLLLDATGNELFAQTLPAGIYGGNGTRGWQAVGGVPPKKWQYLDKTGTPLGGIFKMLVIDRSAKVPGQVRVQVLGKSATYPVGLGDTPLEGIVVLGNQADAATGYCGETAFVAGDCAFNGAGNQVTCKK